jgi:hypothetical protein
MASTIPKNNWLASGALQAVDFIGWLIRGKTYQVMSLTLGSIAPNVNSTLTAIQMQLSVQFKT